MYNGFPFPPFDDNSLPILYKENTYVFNEALDVIDTISFPDFNLYDFLSADIHNGHLAMTGTFADDFHVEHFTVFERNPVPSNSYYDNFLLLGDYSPCRLPIPEPLPEVIIPNVFTPDGDGLNDTWQVRDTTGVSLPVGKYSIAGARKYHTVHFPVPAGPERMNADNPVPTEFISTYWPSKTPRSIRKNVAG